MDALKVLIDRGPDKKYYKVKAVVLERYSDIQTARRIMCMWRDITVALGFDEKRWRHIAASYRRVDAQVKAGFLTPGESQLRQPPAKAKPSLAAKDRSLSTLPGTFPAEGDEMRAELERRGVPFT